MVQAYLREDLLAWNVWVNACNLHTRDQKYPFAQVACKRPPEAGYILDHFESDLWKLAAVLKMVSPVSPLPGAQSALPAGR